MMGIGRATTRTPAMAHIEPHSCPSAVVGTISPYPTLYHFRIILIPYKKSNYIFLFLLSMGGEVGGG